METQREAVALQEQIEKMIQVNVVSWKQKDELQLNKDWKHLKARSEPHVAVANDLILTQVNSKLSHDIKKNDFSLSHMVKNYEGRKQFLRTIELVRMIITLDLDPKKKMFAERNDPCLQLKNCFS